MQTLKEYMTSNREQVIDAITAEVRFCSGITIKDVANILVSPEVEVEWQKSEKLFNFISSEDGAAAAGEKCFEQILDKVMGEIRLNPERLNASNRVQAEIHEASVRNQRRN